MPQVEFLPAGKVETGDVGETVLEIALRGGVDIGQQCGGRGTCGKCRILVLDGETNTPSELEIKKLSREELEKGIRLACQTVPQSQLHVEVLTEVKSISTTKTAVNTDEYPLKIGVVAHEVVCEPPSLSDWRDDARRLEEALEKATGGTGFTIDTEVLKQLPLRARELDWSFTVFCDGDEIVGISPAGEKLLGLAVDIGSTKIAGYLLDLTTGELLVSGGRNNPQRAYGSDIITRLTYALESQENSEKLQFLLANEINALGKELCGKAGCSADSVIRIILVGNTAMHHLFFDIPVRYLTEAPYIPACTKGITEKGTALGLAFGPGSSCLFLPNIAGFIGSDHVAMILSQLDRLKAGKTSLLLDVGTNTEICLYRDGDMASVSTPSGPAFEGGHIACGMAASEGAVEGVTIEDGKVSLQVIGGGEPKGICGSGIIDAIAELYKENLIDWRGRFKEGKQYQLHKDIHLTQKDIQEFMLAKGAIGAGIAVLLEARHITPEDLDQVIVAGAFGAHINVEQAIAIGLFPPIPVERYIQAGNAAGVGAVRALLSEDEADKAASIQREIEYLELAVEKSFRDAYTKASFFPRNDR